MNLFNFFGYTFVFFYVNCDIEHLSKNSKPLSQFRKKVEDVPDDNANSETEDESETNLVSFLVKNAKNFFEDTADDDTLTIITELPDTTSWPKFKSKEMMTPKTLETPKDDWMTKSTVHFEIEENKINDAKNIAENKETGNKIVYQSERLSIPLSDYIQELSSSDSTIEYYENYSPFSESHSSAVIDHHENYTTPKNLELIVRDTKNKITTSNKIGESTETSFISINTNSVSSSVSIDEDFPTLPLSVDSTTSNYDNSNLLFIGPEKTSYNYQHTILLSASPDLIIDSLEDVILYENFTYSNTLREKNDVSNKNEYFDEENNYTDNIQMIDVPKELSVLKKAEEEEIAMISSSVFGTNLTLFRKEPFENLSCIACSNIEKEECNDPRHKLIPSMVCQHSDDVCYTLRTPFGVVTRGCTSTNRNVSTYVCSCNLCNNLQVIQVPILFPDLKAWAENVIELSRTKKFRKSILKKLSCLSCIVNVTTKSENDVMETKQCLEGKINQLPKVECKENEICGIKAVRSEGYIWRGCLKRPYYNYWWTFCDSDLCNIDPLVSIFDSFYL